MTIYDVILVILGCGVSGVITLVIVCSNRKSIERNNRIDTKNNLLQDIERRALYIWNGQGKGKDFNLDLEHSHLLSDIKRIQNCYKELGKCCKDPIPSELREFRIVAAAENIEMVVDSPEKFTPEELSTKRDKIRELTETLESIPSR